MLNFFPSDGHNIGEVLVQRAGDGGGGVVMLVAELVGVDVAGAEPLPVPVLVILQTQPPAPQLSRYTPTSSFSPGSVNTLKTNVQFSSSRMILENRICDSYLAMLIAVLKIHSLLCPNIIISGERQHGSPVARAWSPGDK